MEPKDIDKILQEIGGFRIPDATPGIPTTGNKYGGYYGAGHPLSTDPETGEEYGPPQKRNPDYIQFGINQFDTWQMDVYNRLISGTYPDLFINVSPAGGKTAPMVQAWKHSFVRGRVHPGDYDRILWVTPTVQLANQVFYNDLKKQLVSLIINWMQEDHPAFNPDNPQFPLYLFPPDIQHQIATRHGMTAKTLNITPDMFNSLRNTIDNDLLYLSAHGQTAGTLGDNTVAAVCTYPYAPMIFQKLNPKIIVIDELQQYVPIYAESSPDLSSRAEQFIDIMKLLKSNTNNSLIFLTGSMNGNVAKQIGEFINSSFNRKLELIATHVKNRAQISVFPHSKMKTQQHVIELIKRTVYDRIPGNAMILFNIKNANPEFAKKKAIIPIANQLIRQLPQRSIKTITGYDPNLEDIETNDDDTRSYHRSPMPNELPMKYRYPSPYNNAGERHIPNGRLTLAQAAALVEKDLEDPQYIATYLKYMLSFENKPTNYGQPQPDPFLAKCILCGFAYLAGGKDRDIKMDKRDIEVVQNLFKQGKIYFLLATDMIGVGTTLTIRNLYIPSLSKFISPLIGMGPIDDSSLVQLINRVGRDPRMAATIYCDNDDYARIVKVLNEDPSSAVEPAIFGQFGSAIEKAGNKFGFLKHRVVLMFKLLHHSFE